MANLTKEKRDRMISFIEQLKEENDDDSSIIALNELENYLSEKKFGLIFEEHTEEVDEKLINNIPILIENKSKTILKDEKKPFNFVIEGDNLHALKLLEKTHKGKIDCIYIDPPYNTGARDWKYNNDYVDKLDAYRHSKWLSMMKSRLLVAKKLLKKEDSVLICTIDDKEYTHLGVLLEEIFPEAKITMISSVINPAGKAKKGGVDFSRIDEYIYFLQIGKAVVLPEVRDTEKIPVAWETFRRHSLANGRGKHGVGACGPNQFYPIYVDNKTKKIVEIGEPIMEGVDRFSVKDIPGCTTVFPVRDNGIEMNWGGIREEALRRLEKGYMRVGKYDPNKPQQYSIQYLTGGVIKDIENGDAITGGYEKDGSIIAYYPNGRAKVPTTAWNKPSHNATSYGTDLLKSIFDNAVFDYPKSLYAVRDCINTFIANKKDAIVLDFFAGSGTTMHAVNLLNAEDGGKRQCIVVTNNEISYEEEKRLTAEGYKKGDKEWEKLGIANHVTWPRISCCINGVDIKGKPLKGEYLNTNIKLKDGFDENVKYLKCDWTPRKPQDYLLSNVLCLHIKELIELQKGIQIDNTKYMLILNKDDFKNYITNNKKPEVIEMIWINKNIIFNSVELEELQKYEYLYIPDEFYGSELREVAE